MIWLLYPSQIRSPHPESSISLFHTLWSSEPTPLLQLQIIPVRPLLLRRPARLPFTSLLISGIEVFPFFFLQAQLSSSKKFEYFVWLFSEFVLRELQVILGPSFARNYEFSTHPNCVCVCVHSQQHIIHICQAYMYNMHTCIRVFKYIDRYMTETTAPKLFKSSHNCRRSNS